MQKYGDKRIWDKFILQCYTQANYKKLTELLIVKITNTYISVK